MKVCRSRLRSVLDPASLRVWALVLGRDRVGIDADRRDGVLRRQWAAVLESVHDDVCRGCSATSRGCQELQFLEEIVRIIRELSDIVLMEGCGSSTVGGVERGRRVGVHLNVCRDSCDCQLRRNPRCASHLPGCVIVIAVKPFAST